MPIRFEDHVDHVDALVRAALDAADPAAALERAVEGFGGAGAFAAPVRLVALGKAAGPLARAFVTGCGVQVVDGVCLGPEPQQWGDGAANEPVENVRFFPVDHPMPTERNVEASRAVADVAVAAAREGGCLVVLLSGGASAHLALPVEGVSLADLRSLTEALLRAGAPIGHLNCVRRHIEQLKGGGLLRLARAAGGGEPGARVVTFAVSDVVGDRREAIGSGSTAADPTTHRDALDIIERYGVADVSEAIARHLERGALGSVAETLKPHDSILTDSVYNVIASNETALHAVEREAERLGFTVASCRPGVTGDAAEVGANLVRRAVELRQRGAASFAILAGGETTVRVTAGKGAPPRGGRNLHTALAMAVALDATTTLQEVGVAAFSVATDGVDGTSDAAGAMVSGGTCRRARSLEVDPVALLKACRSHDFFATVGGFVRTGLTGTNVNDIAGVLVYDRLATR